MGGIKMKKWGNPILSELGIDKTFVVSDYTTICNWDGGAENLGLGNEDYTDEKNKPTLHPDWVWCKVHGRWHPKDHGNDGDIS